MSQTPSKNKTRELILGQLRHPLKLRLVICLSVACSWYLFFVMPLVDATQLTTAKIAREQKRIATAREVEELTKTLAPHHGTIPAGSNLSELMRHVIDHLRTSPLKLINLSPEASKDLGPYDAIGIQLALEGPFSEICAFLRWVENEGRPLRVDSVRIDHNQQDHGQLKAQITLLSMAEKSPATPKTKPAAGKSQSSKTAE
jgi:Tfp pilus assembly protein PilO